MPTYVYRCDACDHRFEIVQRMTEDALTGCPTCKEPKLVKEVQAAGFALKGTGWYVTDFRDKGKKPAATTAEGESAKTIVSGVDTKSESTAESKSEAKTETKSETPKPASTGTAS